MRNERPSVLDYHVPEGSSGMVKWVRRLPRPSRVTCIALLLTAAAAFWLHADSAPWKVVRTFDGVLTWHGVSADGTRLLAVPVNRQIVRIYDTATGQTIRDLHRPTGAVRTAAFSPDGRRVWSIGDGSDDTAYLWDVSSGQLLASHHSKSPPFGFDWLGTNYASPFSPDGRWIAATQLDELVIFDGHTGAIVKHLPEAYFAVFSPDNRYLAALSGQHRQVCIWETQTWRQVIAFTLAPGSGLVGDDGHRVAFSPDSKTLIAGFNRQIDLWTAATNQVVFLASTARTVWDCGFSPDGRYIMTAEYDGGDLCQVWDAATGREVSSATMGAFPYFPAISPDGSRDLCDGMILDFPALKPLLPSADAWTGRPLIWLPHREAFVATDLSGPPLTRLSERRRPEAAYGLLWLPEAWVMLLGIGVSAWLFRRDLRRWRCNPVEP